eukprot:554015-Rhodomonas_salina.1
MVDTDLQCFVTMWKGGASGRCLGETIWTEELAKIRQWMARTQASWEELYIATSVYSDLAGEAENAGYLTWAWDTMDSLRWAGRFSLLVGPTPLEACPTFNRWLHWSEHPGDRGYCPQERALILLDAVPREHQLTVLEAAATGDAWAVIGQSALISPEASDWLASHSIMPCSLPTEKAKVYQKGWWRTGTKRPCRPPPGTVMLWQSQTLISQHHWDFPSTGLLPPQQE